MTWITLYITGKSDFREIVRKKLDHSKLNFMPGYIENALDDNYKHDLYWIDDAVKIRQVKEAIGSKIILKYRLQFFNTLEAFIEHQEKSLSRLKQDEEENFPVLHF